MSQDTPRAQRTHIGIFGPTNAGKSSLLNALLHQQAAITSPVAGTTTDVVYRNMEIHGLGPCTLMDTPGWDDFTALQEQRLQRTKQVIDKTDIALIVIPQEEGEQDKEMRTIALEWSRKFHSNTRIIYLVNHFRTLPPHNTSHKGASVDTPLQVNCHTGEGIEALLSLLKEGKTGIQATQDLTAGLTQPGDIVLLVMPQDASAPQGRLIMPQVQTIRHLLDKGCNPLCTTPQQLTCCLQSLNTPPALIITDSQVFAQVEALTPSGTRLTSFSILLACQKGDPLVLLQGAKRLLTLSSDARILIAEACSHTPQHEDIGRVKLPAMLRKKLGENISIDIVSGNDFPADMTHYDLVIHCGACLFTRTHVMNRIEKVQEWGIPITNYGMAIAALTGIIDKVSMPL